jgi:hypothetical protein
MLLIIEESSFFLVGTKRRRGRECCWFAVLPVKRSWVLNVTVSLRIEDAALDVEGSEILQYTAALLLLLLRVINILGYRIPTLFIVIQMYLSLMQLLELFLVPVLPCDRSSNIRGGRTSANYLVVNIRMTLFLLRLPASTDDHA